MLVYLAVEVSGTCLTINIKLIGIKIIREKIKVKKIKNAINKI